jgi:hypothetical protein
MKYMMLKTRKITVIASWLLLLCCNTNAQKQKMLTLGPSLDAPMGNNLGYSIGLGGNLSFIAPVNERVAPLLSVSYLLYRYKRYRFPSGGAPTTDWEQSKVYKITGGVMTRLGGNWFNITEAGILLERQSGGSNYNDNRFLISTGPALFLPAGKNKVRLGLSLGYSGGLFFNLGVAYGLNL